MREILFRYIWSNGKDFISEEFTLDQIGDQEVKGFLYENGKTNQGYDIISCCQWTGLVDCKGNKIFENDLIKWIIYDNGWDGENFHLNKNKIVKQGIGIVYWSQDHFQIKGCKKSISSLTWSASKEVIGNRFQNPELIKD